MLKTEIGVGGMVCDMCEAHVNDAIRRSFKVRSAKADRRRSLVTVLSEEPLDETRVREVIAETGYDFLSMREGPYEKKGLLGLFR